MPDHKKPHIIQPYQTVDGSWTLYDETLDVHYRSRHGAKTESRHVFLEGTRLPSLERCWRVLEFGFGSAVNFTQTMRAALGTEHQQMEYHSVEKMPVDPEVLEHLEGEEGKLVREALSKARGLGPGERVEVSFEGIKLVLHVGPWQDALLPGDFQADAYFHDPFGPKVNPEAWGEDVFKWAKGLMSDEGILATYSSASAPKRAMHKAGFVIAKMPGPGFKREITVASPSRERLDHATCYPLTRYQS